MKNDHIVLLGNDKTRRTPKKGREGDARVVASLMSIDIDKKLVEPATTMWQR